MILDVKSSHRAILSLDEFTPIAAVSLAKFTSEEVAILLKYGRWMEALVNGNIEAFTEAQTRLIKVSNGEKTPLTIFETTWKKYIDELSSSTNIYKMKVRDKEMEDYRKKIQEEYSRKPMSGRTQTLQSGDNMTGSGYVAPWHEWN